MGKRINYTTTMDKEHIRALKFLAVEKDTRANLLLEEAIRDLLSKYGKETPPTTEK